ncbi:MAG: chitobiase/beta-hexosaminidase C-terminal domain-containing protein, partial [Prevotella sp.]|nr:chitobiase/beta-hexosaminidase C-terminal domain-containing protein [Prevotella sp.]
MKKRLIKFRVVSLAMLTLLLSFLTSSAYAVDFTLQTNSSTFAEGGTNSLVASQSGVTFTYLKGSSGDFANVPQSDHIRMYQGSTLTIESAASITNLKVNCTTSSYGPANITIDENELSSGTWTGNAKKIVMTAKAQARITSIVVTLNDAEIPVKVPTITADTYFIGSTNVTLACETEGASIYYTTNGDAVTTENGTLYDGNPFAITATTTVKAIAVKDADSSFENKATFTAVDTKADLASVKDLAKGSLFGFTGDATVVANPDNTNVYIKDANSFSLIYDSKKATTLPVGSKIVPNWIAKTDVYNALFEIVPLTELVAAEGEPAAVTYDEATFADVVEANVNKVVVFKNLEYTLGTGKNITFKEGEQTIAGYNKFSLTIDEPVEG